MSKAYSNKALPPGTILREWRLEQVLGVGGFGIVYKGRGIYFDELVAIKEYFPSAISERDEDDTVVPIDSNAEEVHALGLKKFVEEAKLLWNLSTPTRHPNIVSVRSLFEIHGTAYMVMDFEDGVSLAKLLKDGKRWNEASLTAMFRPIAEGLDRAHRVGVLHRDIKPPNILINDDGRPVLIDFGSARFESGEATSTSVTFHTPPYAAIEQYVRTYQQGPWTDIYALGVVLYQCITGEKPPEVLERMHGGLGRPLAEGDWPGYSRMFLAAVDAAMIVKPSERPQSIPKWLAMFDAPDAPIAISAPPPQAEEDPDATVIARYEADDIVPVAPAPPGFSKPGKPDTPVPSDTGAVRFKRAGEDTRGEKISPPPAGEKAGADAPAQSPATPEAATKRDAGGKAPDASAGKAEPATAPAAEPPPPARPLAGPDQAKGGINPVMIGGAAAALAALAAGGWYLSRNGDEPAAGQAATAEAVVAAPIDIEASGGIAPAIRAFADQARAARAPAAAIRALDDAAARLAMLDRELQRLAADPAQADAVKAQQDEMARLAQKAAADFSAVLLREADGRVGRLAADLPWADPRHAGAAAGQGAAQQNTARQLRQALAGLRDAAARAGSAADAVGALAAAQQALVQSGAFNLAIARTYRAQASPAATATATATAEPAPTAEPPTDSGARGQARELFPAKLRSFNAIVSEARDITDDVIDLGRGSEPGANASQDARDGWRIRQANVQTARNYLSYLDTLVNSMRGERTEREVDANIANAQETRRYLQQLRESSRASWR